jgi:hypothetical protein
MAIRPGAILFYRPFGNTHRSSSMSRMLACTMITLIGAVAGISVNALAQAPQPQPGYFDIPPGFDFPANKQTLEQFRKDGNVSAQRLHVWNVFAGMTQPTPDGKHPIFETWYSEGEAFAAGPQLESIAPRRIIRQFRVPQQFQGKPGQTALEAVGGGDALLSEVMFNFPNFNHIRGKGLNRAAELENLLQSGAPDPSIANNKTIPAFPVESISLKTVWWPVKKDQPTPMPIWDPETNPLISAGNPYKTWKRTVAIDPTRTNIPPNETMTITFLNSPRPNSHVVGLDKFHFVELDAQTAANAMANSRLAQFVSDVFGPGRPLQAGDFVVFSGTHLTTKEIDDWVWATFWWHDRPDTGPFAADRPNTVKNVWRNYLMSASYDLNLPHDPQGKPHIAFNPWLEAHFRDGIISNCMNCHHRAAFGTGGSGPNFVPIFRGNPDPADPAYAAGLLRTDFLWSVPFNAN